MKNIMEFESTSVSTSRNFLVIPKLHQQFNQTILDVKAQMSNHKTV